MILVAGGTGFIGAAIVRKLSARGTPTAVLTRDPRRVQARFEGLILECRAGDVSQPDSLKQAMHGIDGLIISIAFPNMPMENPKRGYTFEAIDAIGTENLVAAAKSASVDRIVYISGAGAAAGGQYHWLRAKWRAETAVRQSGIPYAIIRPSWVYGPEDKSLNRFLAIARMSPIVPLIGNSDKQRLQPVFVQDLAQMVIEAMDNRTMIDETFDIGGPEVLTMRAILKEALAAMGKRRIIVDTPKWLAKASACLLRYLPGPPFTPDAVDFVTMDALADNTKLATSFGIQPRSLRQGLATYLTDAKARE